MRGLLSPLLKLITFLVVTVIATYFLALTIANTNNSATYSYKAVFTDATSLNVGDDVRIAGVRVGTVTGLKVLSGDKVAGGHSLAQITFTVQRATPLPQCAQVAIRYRNLIGQRYVDVSQNVDNPTICNSTAIMRPGGTVPVAQTVNALDLTQLFAGFQPLFQGLNPDEINQLSIDIIQTLQGEGGTIDNLVTNVGDLTNALADKDQVIGSLIDNLDSLLTTVSVHSQQLGNLVTELQSFVSGLAQDRTTIGNSIDGVNQLAIATTGLLSAARPGLQQDVTKLTKLAANLNAGGGDLAGAIQNTPLIAGELTRTATYGSWFNFYLCQVAGTITLGTVNFTPTLPTQTGGSNRCAGT